MKVMKIEPTPNPNAVKMTLDGKVIEMGSRSFESASEAEGHSLAKSLFRMPEIKAVFFMPTFVTVTKDPEAEWGPLAEQVKGAIEAYAPEAAAPVQVAAPTSPEDAMLRKIEEVMDTRVRPALAGDGGGLEIVGYENYVLTIRYQGACGTCPSSISGTLRAIEHMLRVDVDPALSVVSAQ
ncbi:MAG TPA: NifU family protein [Pantanalinema sp.]